MNSGRGPIRCLLVPLLVALFFAPGPAVADDGYTVTVRLILVRGERTARTDAAVWFPSPGQEQDLEQGARLKPGGVLQILYPIVTVYVDDSAGNRFFLECPACTEEDPLTLNVGDPGADKPFIQAGGRVTWQVEPVEEGVFRIMLDVLMGPEEELIPVAVRGTLFRTEAENNTHALTVANGLVAYGAEGGPAFQLVSAGKAVAGGSAPATAPATAASASVLEEMGKTIEPPALPGPGLPDPVQPDPLSGPGIKHLRPPVNMAWKWAALGGGILMAGAGSSVLMMAASKRDQARIDAKQKYLDLVELKTTEYGFGCDDAMEMAQEDAQAGYDDDYNSTIQPMVITGWVMTGVGAVAAVGGLVWLLVDQPAADVLPVTVAPIPMPHGGGLTLDWSF